MICYKCGKNKETRPYGPNGQTVCVACAFETPESTRLTEQQMGSQMDACGSVIVIGSEAGPVPHVLSDRKLS